MLVSGSIDLLDVYQVIHRTGNNYTILSAELFAPFKLISSSWNSELSYGSKDGWPGSGGMGSVFWGRA